MTLNRMAGSRVVDVDFQAKLALIISCQMGAMAHSTKELELLDYKLDNLYKIKEDTVTSWNIYDGDKFLITVHTKSLANYHEKTLGHKVETIVKDKIQLSKGPQKRSKF